ncbi:molybdenum cofactor biosynthesis protein MoaB [Halomicroarcula sp. F28]|uniref:molybdopterin-binding protein n=1 Tax=Haloarcula salinisoli TaxID=2487746 RepID=UPI001C73348C|nr:molybdopterin-binding protein [Halomicroarcula salinisoli]MBX0287547.1 molybdenum cofactor biosynthesis protein MoaB [Halomicroarcula salinisoli]
MVDFQSRDTRRGPTIDDESESESADSESSSEDDATGTADDTGDTAAGNSTEVDGEAATSADPLAGETATEDPETAESDPLAEEHGSAAEQAAEDHGSAAPTDGNTEAAVRAEDTDQTTPAAQTAGTTTPSRAVDVAVVTVSGDRAALEDSITGAFEAAGHTVVRRERLQGGYDAIQQMVDTLVDRDVVDVVVTVGGVGLTADDMAIEAVHPLLEKALPGFGEAFRARLADHIGTGIVGVRSTAGISDGTLVFCLPGDAEAAELAVGEILATEAPVLVDQLDQ